MKGTRFADVAAIQERVTAVLRSIPKEVFADSFQKLYDRCQQCVVKDVDYFEGQVNLFVFWYHSPNFLDTPRIHSVFVVTKTFKIPTVKSFGYNTDLHCRNNICALSG
jgi:hypothetical protein